MNEVEIKFGLGRGLNRLFLALTVAWATYSAVLYPMQRQWEGQNEGGWPTHLLTTILGAPFIAILFHAVSGYSQSEPSFFPNHAPSSTHPLIAIVPR